MFTYDVIIVGARCAGSATALLLARRGYRVLLVDRATFPSDTLSGHYIHSAGMAYLKRWGLLEQVAALNAPAVSQYSLDLGDFALTGSPPPTDGVAVGYCPRRTVFDKMLVDAAVEAGAELREGFSVQEILQEDGRVTGIRGHTKGHPAVTETARLVVGADGMRSIVARTVQAAQYNTVPSLTCAYYTYWSGVPVETVELYPRFGRFIVAVPTNDNLTFIGIAWPHSEFHQYRADYESNYLKTLELAPGLAARVREGQRVERFFGMSDSPNFFRKPYGPGWALVGDAGYHKDPITAQGMTDAFRDAELLAKAVDAGLSDCQPLLEALAGYEQQRNEATLPMYHMTCQLASLTPPPPEMQQFFAALQGNQTDIDRFHGVMAGTVPIPEFYAPENMQRIIETARQPEAFFEVRLAEAAVDLVAVG